MDSTHLPPIPHFDMVPTMDPTNVPLTSCPHCAAQMPETAAFCPGCGLSVQAATRVHGTVGALPEIIAGALAYLTFIPAIVFLVLDPYKKNRFVRFHSLQCLLLCGAAILFAIALKLASVVLFIIPVLGPLLSIAGLHRRRSRRGCDLAGAGGQGIPGRDVQTAPAR